MPRDTRTADADILAGTWTIDPTRAAVRFSGRTSFLTPMLEASFSGVTGSIGVPAQHDVLGGGDLEVLVDVRTMRTRKQIWDDMLTVLDPFEAGKHPFAAYRSTMVVWERNRVDIDGVLTLRGVSRAVELQATYSRGGAGDRMRVQASGEVDRQEFGIRTDVPGLTALTPRRMRLDIDLQLQRL